MARGTPALHFSWRTEERRQAEAARHTRAKAESQARMAARSGAATLRQAAPVYRVPVVLDRGRAPDGCLAPWELPERLRG